MLDTLTGADAFGPGQLALIAATYMIAAFVKGATGLGFSTMCLPFLVVAVGLKEAMPLVLLPSLASNLFIMRRVGQVRATVRQFWPMYAATVPGLVVGLWLLDTVDVQLAVLTLGLILVLYSLHALTTPALVLPQAAARRLAPVSGFATGVVNGLTGSQILPVLPYLMALDLPPGRFIQALNCSFTLSTVVMAVGLSRLGLLTLQTVVVSALGLVFVYAGTRLGAAARERMSPSTFRVAVLAVVLVLGLGLVVRAL